VKPRNRDPAPLDQRWRPARHRTAHSAEQDRAAGGSARRQIQLARGESATGSIEVKQFPQGQARYAYLRFSVKGKTVNRYVGRVTGGTRAEQLQEGWELAYRNGLLDQRQ
jgi:DNA mismatch endonuclease (patch repair protein)